ncbi:MAG TPA: YihY/virulence factor BrkB family protein [Chthoniobacterales bacterium]
MARNPDFSQKSFIARLWALMWKSVGRYSEIGGDQRAASFAYYAFFSLFPLIVLLVTVCSLFLFKDQQEAVNAVIEKLREYLPLSEGDRAMVVKTIEGVIHARAQASAFALITLLWSSLRFFQALVQGVNRAWGCEEYSWWHLPLKNLAMVGILASALVLGVLLPTLLGFGVELLKHTDGFLSTVPIVKDIMANLINNPQGLIALYWSKAPAMIAGFVVLLYMLTLFYKYAPTRATSLRDVWMPALLATCLLKVVQEVFAKFAGQITNVTLYGAFAGIMALLFWIYISGSIIIFGGCISAAGRELRDGNSRKKK